MKKEKIKNFLSSAYSDSISNEVSNYLMRETKPENYIDVLKNTANALAGDIDGKVNAIEKEIERLNAEREKLNEIKRNLLC